MFDVYELFESVGIIVDAKLKELSLDRTILGTIVDNSESSKGIYKVSYESAIFSANSTDSSLEIDDLVYVGVPQGDYTNAYIISKKVVGASEKTALLPFKNFIKEIELRPAASKYIVPSSSTETILWSNGQSFQPFTNINKSKRLGITAKVQASSSEVLEPTSDKKDYGIRLYIKSKEVIEKQTFFYLNTIDFNIYKLLSPHGYKTEGQKIVEELFDISDIDNIVEIRAEIYGNVTLPEGQSINITDFKIYLGNLLEDYSKEGLTLYTTVDPIYSDAIEFSNNIYARWVYKEDNEIKVITPYTKATDIPSNVTIEWFKNDDENSLFPNNNRLWQITVDNSALSRLKDSEKYTAIVKYNSIETDIVHEYEASMVLENMTENRKIFRPETKDFGLRANITSFKDIYSPDGSIVDTALIKDAENYMMRFPSTPFAKAATTQLDLKINVKITIPSSKSNLYVEPSQQGGYVKQEDVTNGYTYSQDFAVDSQTGIFPQLQLLPFAIGEYYSPAATNNTIICELSAITNDGTIVETESYSLNIEFARSGICKSDYILYPVLTDEQGNRCRSIKVATGSQVNINAKLYNAAGEEIEITHPIEWNWYGRNVEASPTDITISPIGNSGCILTSYLDEYNEEHNYNYVLKGNYSVYKDGIAFANVFCLIPLGINVSKMESEKGEFIGYEVDQLEGPTLITYNSAGGEPSFYSAEYELYTSSDNLYPGVKWESVNDYSDGTYPTLKQDNKGRYLVHAPTMFTKGSEVSIYKAVQADNAENVLWVQPIISYQTKSFSSIVNDWDGRSVEIRDEQGKTQSIMTPMLGAGKKDGKGLFSGVLLGDVDNEDGSTPVTGIYGYGQSEQSYAFKEDGTAFIGKSGKGRINFNGNDGLIYSGNFNGKLLVKKSNSDETTGYAESDEGYYTYNDQIIYDDSTKKMQWKEIKHEDGSVSLDRGDEGTLINLKSGEIIINDGYFRGDIIANSLSLGDNGTADFLNNYVPFETEFVDEHNKYSFKLEKNGLLTASNAVIDGNIMAKQGQIGNWLITESGLITNSQRPSGLIASDYVENENESNDNNIDYLTFAIEEDLNTGAQWAIITGIDENKNNISTIKIPKTYRNEDTQREYVVTKIGFRAFRYNTIITEVILSDSIFEIGTEAFEGCTNLKRVIGGKNCIQIGYQCFQECKNLELIELPELQCIGEEAFERCVSLARFQFSKKLTSIGTQAFKNCENLVGIFINPDDKLEIGKEAFEKCYNLTQVWLSKNVFLSGWVFHDAAQAIIYYEGDSIPENWDKEWNIDQNVINYSCDLNYPNNSLINNQTYAKPMFYINGLTSFPQLEMEANVLLLEDGSGYFNSLKTDKLQFNKIQSSSWLIDNNKIANLYNGQISGLLYNGLNDKSAAWCEESAASWTPNGKINSYSSLPFLAIPSLKNASTSYHVAGLKNIGYRYGHLLENIEGYYYLCDFSGTTILGELVTNEIKLKLNKTALYQAPPKVCFIWTNEEGQTVRSAHFVWLKNEKERTDIEEHPEMWQDGLYCYGQFSLEDPYIVLSNFEVISINIFDEEELSKYGKTSIYFDLYPLEYSNIDDTDFSLSLSILQDGSLNAKNIILQNNLNSPTGNIIEVKSSEGDETRHDVAFKARTITLPSGPSPGETRIEELEFSGKGIRSYNYSTTSKYFGINFEQYFGYSGTGAINIVGDLRINGTDAVSGTFTSADGKTITVTQGIITGIEENNNE